MVEQEVKRRPGRPATGKTTAMLMVRLPVDMVELIKRRARANDQSVSKYLGWYLQHDFRPRASRTSYRNRRAVKVPEGNTEAVRAL